MADERQYEPPVLMAWLAQHGFLFALFGPALLVGVFFGSNAAFLTFFIYIIACVFVLPFVAYSRSRKAPIRVTPIIKNDWPSKYTWKNSQRFLYAFLTLINVILYLSFIQSFPLEWSSQLIVYLGRVVFFVFAMSYLGLRIAGVMNGDARALSAAS